MGRLAYRLAQEHVTKSLPRARSQFPRYLEQLKGHIDAFNRHDAKLAKAAYLEFGAGWDLFYPLGFACAGIPEMHLFDVTRLANTRYINDVITGFQAARPEFFVRNISPITSIDDLRPLGIFYHAPGDARKTGLGDASIDLVSTTSTLEHVPKNELIQILQELKRVCRPGALISMLIDYEDHFGQRASDAGPYNFLRFEAVEWTRYNPGIHHQNRLRHRDYIQMFEEAGLVPLEIEGMRHPDWERMLTAIPIAQCFSSYSLEELSITTGRFLLRV